MEIYVGNLSYGSTEQSLTELFSQYGQVGQVKVVKDRDTGRSKGFGFVTMENADEARAAIEALNGMDVDGRKITVNEARPKESTGGGGGGGGGRPSFNNNRRGGGGGGGGGERRARY